MRSSPSSSPSPSSVVAILRVPILFALLSSSSIMMVSASHTTNARTNAALTTTRRTMPFSSSPSLFLGIGRGGDDGTTNPPVLPTTFTTLPPPSQNEPTTTTPAVTTTTSQQQSSPPQQTLTQTLQKLRDNPKLANAIERTGPAILMLGLLGALIHYTGDVGLTGLICLLQVGMYLESTGVIRAGKELAANGGVVEVLERWWWFATIFAGTTVRHIVVGSEVMDGAMVALYDLGVFGMVALGLVLGVCRMASAEDAGVERFRRYLSDWAGSNFALIFLLGQSSFWIKTIQTYGLTWVLYPALLVVVNDTMAYVFGVLFGNHKLIPKLSPKKTVEGFVGAGLSTAAVSIPLFDLFVRRGWFQDVVQSAADSVSPEQQVNNIFNNVAAAIVDGSTSSSSANPLLNAVLCSTTTDTSKCRMRHALILAAYASLIAPFGGFLASAVKRAHGAKDFGSLIPGHGGVIDRFDCQIVMAPFVFLYLRACI